MGTPFKPLKVKLIIGLISYDEPILKNTHKILIRKFGQTDTVSPLWDFDKTDYYEKEMGKNLKRLFLSFENLVDAQQMPEIKLLTNKIERRISKNKTNRVINIDPGYITLSKLILATTKNFAHRIYIKKGIFEEITLSFRNNSFQAGSLTYPDYRSESHIHLFNTIRNKYYQQIEKKYGLSQLSRCI